MQMRPGNCSLEPHKKVHGCPAVLLKKETKTQRNSTTYYLGVSQLCSNYLTMGSFCNNCSPELALKEQALEVML